jgi:hypothetical protein
MPTVDQPNHCPRRVDAGEIAAGMVSHEDANLDVGSNEARSVDKNEVRAGYGEDNPTTK